MSVNHNPDTDTAEFVERCEAYLSAAHDLVLAHIESSRTTNTELSPRDQAFTLQQRAHFLDHLHVSVGYLESLIEYQEALATIFHGRPINPHTGLPIFYRAVTPTAHRVPLDCSAVTVPPPDYTQRPEVTPPACFITQFAEVAPKASFNLRKKLAHKSTAFPTTSIAGSTTSTTRGLTFTTYHHHRFAVHQNNRDVSNWKKSLATAAHSLCRTLDDCGAYSQVAVDPEWDSHPSNIISTTSASGITTITIRARPIITKPTIYKVNEKKTAVINLFNYREKQWKEWTAASMVLHQAMISSIGALNLATIERLSGHADIISLSCRQLLAHITVIFGSLHASPATCFSLKTTSKKNLHLSLDFATLSVATRSTTISSPIFRTKSARSPRYTGSKTLCSDARSSISPSERGNPPTPASLHARTTI
jgi:hypothetical protein